MWVFLLTLHSGSTLRELTGCRTYTTILKAVSVSPQGFNGIQNQPAFGMGCPNKMQQARTCQGSYLLFEEKQRQQHLFQKFPPRLNKEAI